MWFWKRWGIYLYVVATFVLAGVVLLQTGNMIMFFGAIIPMFIVLTSCPRFSIISNKKWLLGLILNQSFSKEESVEAT